MSEKETRRLIEHLTTAHIEADKAYKSLLDVSIFNTSTFDRARIDRAKEHALTLQSAIAGMLSELQGEQAEV